MRPTVNKVKKKMRPTPFKNCAQSGHTGFKLSTSFLLYWKLTYATAI